MTRNPSNLSDFSRSSGSGWQVYISSDCDKKLCRLSRKQRERIQKALVELEKTGPSHRNIKKLQARPEWSLRVGGKRVILRIDFVNKQFLAVDLGSRGDVYKK